MKNIELQKGKYLLSTDKSKLDIPYLHQFISRSYWAENIPIETVQRSIEGSLCFGLFDSKRQIGFARVISDLATFAYLADVFIDEKCRGQGLSKWMMEVIMAHPDLQGLRRFILGTRDAHGLYTQFGFTAITHAERWMQIHNADAYKKSIR